MKVTTRAAVARWLDALRDRYAVIAPQAVDGIVNYRPLEAGAEPLFDFQRTVQSAKAFFFPETEVILEIEKRGSDVILREPETGRDQVIWGVRPCDARGLRALDALLLEHQPADVYYAERRARTTLIGLACPRLWDDCFCTSLGGAPDDPSDVDLMFYERQGGYWVEGVTDKGLALLAGLEVEEAEGSPPPSDRAGEQVPLLPPEAWSALFADPFWQRLADRCLSCRACAYVCPTCRCFDVRDETVTAGPGYAAIQRLRAWDTCMASAYRRIAGGHNPRPDKAQRLRNRFYCKFCYSPIDFGALACVGCGRCTAVCPAGVDLAEMLAAVAELARSPQIVGSGAEGAGSGDPTPGGEGDPAPAGRDGNDG